MSKRLIIIGNSPSVLNKEFGAEVDNFDTVVRLNNFRTRGYEKHVGTKTDIAFITFATHYSDELAQLRPSQIHLFAAERLGDYEFLEERMNRKGATMLSPYDINILSDAYFTELNGKVCLIGKQRCSLGLIAMEWALNSFADHEVHTYGIDFFAGCKNQSALSHYFNFVTPKDGFHDFDKEHAYFIKNLQHKIISHND